MPIYEYQCTECGHEAEVFLRHSDPEPDKCPACGKGGFQRLISAAGFRLKGGGWYETDFKTGNKRNLAGDSGKSEGESAKSDGGCGKPECNSGKTCQGAQAAA